ncbi:hypothetical protein BELL_0027g00330 [Botrytis elliptica]|uniref:Uncharacterized protein n=1 Tax=Botrytis elliptica TaxID=278938 RepID=A0A4Z1K7W2_9HELO|nr:hypothetical protein BELL_0027g00330 [Botrytis elliptica]
MRIIDLTTAKMLHSLSKRREKDERHAQKQADLTSEINGGRNQRSSYTYSRHSEAGSGHKTEDIHDKIKRQAARLNSSDSKDNTDTEERLYKKHAKKQEGKTPKNSGTRT